MSESLDREIRFLRNHYWSARDPDGRAFVPLADAYRRNGDLAEATSLIEDGIGRLPDFSSGHLVAALVARDRGDAEAALGHLDRVLHLDPENVSALLERSRLSLGAGSREAALRDVRELLRLEPTNWEARGLLVEVEDQDPLAPEVALDGAPDEEWVPPASDGEEERLLKTRTMGELYARQGFVDRAIEVYEHLAALNPGDGELSARLEELKRTEPAVAGSLAIAPEPEDPEDEVVEYELLPGVSESGGEELRPARSISTYLGDLLAWVPGAVPIASLAPPLEELGEAVPVASLAPSHEAMTMAGPHNEMKQAPRQPGDDDLDDFQSWLATLGR